MVVSYFEITSLRGDLYQINTNHVRREHSHNPSALRLTKDSHRCLTPFCLTGDVSPHSVSHWRCLAPFCLTGDVSPHSVSHCRWLTPFCVSLEMSHPIMCLTGDVSPHSVSLEMSHPILSHWRCLPPFCLTGDVSPFCVSLEMSHPILCLTVGGSPHSLSHCRCLTPFCVSLEMSHPILSSSSVSYNFGGIVTSPATNVNQNCAQSIPT